MVKSSLKEMEAHLPVTAPSSGLNGESPMKFVQETKEMKDVLSSESEDLSGVMDQTRKETVVHDKALPMMLAEQERNARDVAASEAKAVVQVTELKAEHDRLERAHHNYLAELQRRRRVPQEDLSAGISSSIFICFTLKMLLWWCMLIYARVWSH